MKIVKRSRGVLWSLALMVFLLPSPRSQAAIEEVFDVVQIGTTTYRNVTVTTKNKNYIFILHSNGMTNIKVADLPESIRKKLGYEIPPPPQAKTNTPAAWARQTLTKIEVPQVKQLEAGLRHWYGHEPETGSLPAFSRNVILAAGAAFLALYLFHCYCCMLICRKAGSEPGPLVWVPLLQLLPLLKAAGMAPVWFLAFLVPVLNLVAQILWCFKITEARGKTLLVALLLIFPLSAPFAVLYLAFSESARPRKEEQRVSIMTLETA